MSAVTAEVTRGPSGPAFRVVGAEGYSAPDVGRALVVQADRTIAPGTALINEYEMIAVPFDWTMVSQVICALPVGSVINMPSVDIKQAFSPGSQIYLGVPGDLGRFLGPDDVGESVAFWRSLRSFIQVPASSLVLTVLGATAGVGVLYVEVRS